MSFHGVALESATYRTLHAHGFSRSSTQAVFVLTDLLARYVTLLSSTCAKYAQHAGRTGLTPLDAFAALEELGVSVDELNEYCLTEGMELGHYAVLTARRVEDLNELKAQLAEGRKQDRDDVIPLVYAPMPDVVYPQSDEDDMEIDGEDVVSDGMDEDQFMEHQRSSLEQRIKLFERPPWLSFSASDSSSPARKRQRTSDWHPPPHIPDFLPPFPHVLDAAVQPPDPPSPQMPPSQRLPARIDKPPSPIPQSVTSTSPSDYLTRVPYDQSTLSSTSEWHLPSPLPPPHPTTLTKQPRLTPQTEPALIAAYHHILTHPPVENSNSPNPARHKVAMALLSHTHRNPRWDPSDTLFSSTAPCSPRVTSMSQTFPIPIPKTPPSLVDNKLVKLEDREREAKFPATQGKPVSYVERFSPLISQQSSRIPDLAWLVLSSSVHTRTTRLAHPPVLVGNGQKLVYGPGIPAPWNATSPPVAPTPAVNRPKEGVVNGISSNNTPKEAPNTTLPDAMLFATWDYEKKDFRQPLATGRKGRTASVQASSNSAFSFGLGSKVRSGSKAG